MPTPFISKLGRAAQAIAAVEGPTVPSFTKLAAVSDSDTEKAARASILCLSVGDALCKTIGLSVGAKHLFRQVRKKRGKRALGFAQKFRKKKAKRNIKKLKRSLSCLPKASPLPAPEGTELVLGCVEHSFEDTRRPSCSSAHSTCKHDACAEVQSPACLAALKLDKSQLDCASESEYEEPEEESDCPETDPDYIVQFAAASRTGPCQGTTLDHHLRREILTTEEAIKRNSDHIDFATNCQPVLAASPFSNTFSIGTEILAITSVC